jgi:hypothetical protein
MKNFSNKRKPGYILLILSFSFCLLWLVKLEIEAASLKSVLAEHHKSLEDGYDILRVKDPFLRNITDNSFISLMDDNAVIQIYNTSIGLLKDELRMTTQGDINIGNQKEKYIKYDSKKDLLSLVSDFAEVSIGKINFEGKEHTGIQMVNFHNTQKIFLLNDRLVIKSVGEDNDFFIEFHPSEKYLKIGSTDLNTGKNSTIKFEKDFIDIQAEGDINITSKNGKVNINGKR